MAMRITETERLFIDEAATEDASFFLMLMNSKGWLTYVGDRNIHSENDAAAYISGKLIKSYETNGFGLNVMRLKENNEAIGICGFIKRDYLPHADIGFAILPGYEGKGYMREAAKNLIAYGFTELRFDEILAITLSSNDRSQQLLYRLGFTRMEDSQPDKSKPAEALFSMKKTS